MHYLQLDVVCLHESPDFNSPLVNQALYGESCTIESSGRHWRRIKLNSDGYEGWVPVSAIYNREAAYLKTETIAKVKAISALLYKEPNVKASIHQKLYHGTVVEVVETTEEWTKVRLLDHSEHWVIRSSLCVNPKPFETLEELKELALQFLHENYEWGGISTKYGFDCSGLIQTLWKWMGITLPRDSKPQSEFPFADTIANIDDLQLGDLVFFGDPVSHVGMYLGEKQFIHCHADTKQQKTGVCIDDLTQEPWRSLFRFGRRIDRKAAREHHPSLARDQSPVSQ